MLYILYKFTKEGLKYGNKNAGKLHKTIYIYIDILRKYKKILNLLNSKLKLILNLLLLGENRKLKTTL